VPDSLVRCWAEHKTKHRWYYIQAVPHISLRTIAPHSPKTRGVALNRQHIIILSDFILGLLWPGPWPVTEWESIFYYQILPQNVFLSQYNPFCSPITSFCENYFNISPFSWVSPVVTVEKFSVSNFYMNPLFHCTCLLSNEPVAMVSLWRNEWRKETYFGSKPYMWQENCHFSPGLSFQEEHFSFCVYNFLCDFPLREKPDGADRRTQTNGFWSRNHCFIRLRRLFRAVTNLGIMIDYDVLEVYVTWLCPQSITFSEES
jgi:hypothetical protein